MTMLFDETSKGWDLIEPTPANPAAEAFAKALLSLVEADRQLQVAKAEANAVNYRPTGYAKDECGREIEDWNRAADAVYDAFKGATNA